MMYANQGHNHSCKLEHAIQRHASSTEPYRLIQNVLFYAHKGPINVP